MDLLTSYFTYITNTRLHFLQSNFTYLNLLDASQVLAKITQQLIACWPNIGLKACLQLARHATHYNRGELNNLLWMRIPFFITGCLKINDHKVLKILELVCRGVT